MWTVKETAKKEAQVLKLYRQNPDISYTEIEGLTGISRRTVPRIFKRLGLHKSAARPQLRKLSSTIEAEISRVYREDIPIQVIMNEFGINRSLLYEVLRRTETPLRPTRSGRHHPSWRGGRLVTKDGYVKIWLSPEHSYASVMRTKDGYVLEHRLAMANYLGRALEAHEQVHHIDGDRQNNVIRNLQLRIGNHGPGIYLRCRSCGSIDIESTEIGVK